MCILWITGVSAKCGLPFWLWPLCSLLDDSKANRYADISPILEKCFLLTAFWQLSHFFASFCMKTPKRCLYSLMPLFPFSLSPLNLTLAFTTPSKLLNKGITGPPDANLNSQLLVLPSHRSMDQVISPSSLTCFPHLAIHRILVFLLYHWLLLLYQFPFLFPPLQPLNSSLYLKAQTWLSTILFLHPLPSEPWGFKYHLCFCLICALKSPSLPLWHKDILHFFLLVYNPLPVYLGARGVWNLDCSRLKKGDVM